MHVCVYAHVCICRHALARVCELPLHCYLVNTDLELFGPGGFIVVFETRVDACSTSSFKS